MYCKRLKTVLQGDRKNSWWSRWGDLMCLSTTHLLKNNLALLKYRQRKVQKENHNTNILTNHSMLPYFKLFKGLMNFFKSSEWITMIRQSDKAQHYQLMWKRCYIPHSHSQRAYCWLSINNLQLVVVKNASKSWKWDAFGSMLTCHRHCVLKDNICQALRLPKWDFNKNMTLWQSKLLAFRGSQSQIWYLSTK